MTIRINYVTSSSFKREECLAMQNAATLSNGSLISQEFEFQFLDNFIPETLEVDIPTMVAAEAKAAYAQVQRPCIVEHAGLIFSEYENQSYPGGLTKPMWNALGDAFLTETHSVGRKAIALAVVGYCDGKSVKTFEGRTDGELSSAPRGNRSFYWDTIFVPHEANEARLTYAELVEQHGIEVKMAEISQSTKAMRAFLDWRRQNSAELWHVTH